MDYTYIPENPMMLADLATNLENDPTFQAYVDQVRRQNRQQATSRQSQEPYGYWSSTPTGPDGEQEQTFVPMERPAMLAAGPGFGGMGQYTPEETRTLRALSQPLPENFGTLPPDLQMQITEARKPVYKTIEFGTPGGAYGRSSQLDIDATKKQALKAQQALYEYGQDRIDEQLKRKKSQLDIRKSEKELNAPEQTPGEKAYLEALGKGRAAEALSKVPGTPEYAAAQKASAEERGRRQAEETGAAAKEARATTVLDAVDDAKKQLGFFSTGLSGQVLRNVGGTSAMDLDKTINTIKANLGFEELQKMREASKTGGALGQVAVKELEFLQSAVSALDTAQSTDQLKKNLDKVKQHYSNWQKITSKMPQPQPQQSPAGFDSDKEKRYQEWKRKQGLQ